MATTSFSLGDHWDKYLTDQIAAGEFKTKAEVVRNALREKQERDEARKAVLAYVQVGIYSGIVDIEPDKLFEQIKREGRDRIKVDRKSG